MSFLDFKAQSFRRKISRITLQHSLRITERFYLVIKLTLTLTKRRPIIHVHYLNDLQHACKNHEFVRHVF